MSNVTPGNWKAGKGCVVSDSKEHLAHGCSDGEVEYYGGYLICETVTPSNADLIATAPAMLKELKRLVEQMEYDQFHGPGYFKEAKEIIAKAEGEEI